jgi:hypothetical protein
MVHSNKREIRECQITHMLTARRFDRLWPSLPLYFSLSFSIALSLALALPSLPTVPQAKLQVVQFSALAARKGLLTKHAEPTSNQTGRNVGDASAMLQTHYASLDPGDKPFGTQASFFGTVSEYGGRGLFFFVAGHETLSVDCLFLRSPSQVPYRTELFPRAPKWRCTDRWR